MTIQKTPSTPVVYKDINLSFIKHPITGDITSVTNADAIKRSVKHLVLSNFNERPFEPHIGANVTALLFEQANPFTGLLINRIL